MKFIIPAVTGAVIGYFTNWLAIKMLFRPYNEIKVFGARVPFTPGLIPKERGRIAKSIGDAIGTYLLDPETFSEALYGEKVKVHVKEWIKEKVIEFKNKKESIGDFLSIIFGDKRDKFIEIFKENIVEKIIGYIKSRDGIETISNAIKSLIKEGFDNLADNKNISNILIKYIDSIANSKNTHGIVSKLIGEKIKELENDKRSIKELLPEDIYDALKDEIYKNDSRVSKAISDTIKSPSIRRSIEIYIEDFVEKSIGKLLTMFMKPEFISSKVVDGIIKYLDNPENHMDIAMTTVSLIDRLLDKKTYAAVGLLTPEIKGLASVKASDYIIASIASDESKELISDAFCEWIMSSRDEILDELYRYAALGVEMAVNSDKLEAYINEAIGFLMDELMKTPSSKILSGLEESAIDEIINVLDSNFEHFIKNSTTDIIEVINIPYLIEEKIRDFDSKLVENIILEISKKELSAITWLGALLGGMIGILTPILQSIKI